MKHLYAILGAKAMVLMKLLHLQEAIKTHLNGFPMLFSRKLLSVDSRKSTSLISSRLF